MLPVFERSYVAIPVKESYLHFSFFDCQAGQSPEPSAFQIWQNTDLTLFQPDFLTSNLTTLPASTSEEASAETSDEPSAETSPDWSAAATAASSSASAALAVMAAELHITAAARKRPAIFLNIFNLLLKLFINIQDRFSYLSIAYYTIKITKLQ